MNNINYKNEKLLAGKYAGYTFDQILTKDLQYAEFLVSLPIVSPAYEDFVKFSKDNIQIYKEKKFQDKLRKQLEKFTKDNN